MAYLDDHPPATQQFREPRRERPSGVFGVHTAENHADEQGTDSGAENVADFIRRRGSYGSYHLLVDSDSIIQLVRFECVAYHIGTHGLNEHTIGISAAVQAHEWDDYGDDYVRAVIVNMARAAARAARWLKREYGIDVPARRISLAEALDGERGFLAHADADPDRRTDPGPRFDWDLFLSTYAELMRGDDPHLEDDVTREDFREWLLECFQESANRGKDVTPYGRLLGRAIKGTLVNGGLVNVIEDQVLDVAELLQLFQEMADRSTPRGRQGGSALKEALVNAGLPESTAAEVMRELAEKFRAQAASGDGA